MKKLLTSLSLLLALAAPVSAFAAGVSPCDPANPNQPPGCSIINLPNATGTVVSSIVNFIFVIAVILALGFLVYGGIRWITSGGDKGGVENARNTIIAAIIGLIVVFLAYFILNLVLQFLTGKGITDLEIPTITGA
ncbi:MAG: pilin [bacterium]|nr:pilin [bacterium]